MSDNRKELILPPIQRYDRWDLQPVFVVTLSLVNFYCEQKQQELNDLGRLKCDECKKNGINFAFDLGYYYDDVWEWPKALLHHVIIHNMQPEKEFIRYIIKRYRHEM